MMMTLIVLVLFWKRDDDIQCYKHCVKSVRIWSYSGPHFPVFSPNAGKCGPD